MNATRYMIVSAHGDAIAEGFDDLDRAKVAAQRIANYSRRTVYVQQETEGDDTYSWEFVPGGEA